MIFPRQVRSGLDPDEILITAVGQPEAGHHFIKDQEDPLPAGDFPQFFQKSRSGEHDAHIARDGLDNDSGEIIPVAFNG